VLRSQRPPTLQMPTNGIQAHGMRTSKLEDGRVGTRHGTDPAGHPTARFGTWKASIAPGRPSKMEFEELRLASPPYGLRVACTGYAHDTCFLSAAPTTGRATGSRSSIAQYPRPAQTSLSPHMAFCLYTWSNAHDVRVSILVGSESDR